MTRVVLAMAIALACGPEVALRAQGPVPDVASAERAFREGDHVVALRAYAAAAEVATASRGALCFGAGVAALRAGQLPEAVLWLERASRRLQDPQPALRGIGFAQRSLGITDGYELGAESAGCEVLPLAIAVVVQTVGLLGFALARMRGARIAGALLALSGIALSVRCAQLQFVERPAVAVALRDAALQREPGGASIDRANVKAGARLVVLERRGDSVRVEPHSGWLPAGSFGVADER